MDEMGNAAEVQQIEEKKEVCLQSEWYENLNLEDTETFIRSNLMSAARNVIAIGYYLKHIRDNELYRQAGYDTIWDYAGEQYGFSKSTTSRYMSRNDKFSKGGNSPVLDARYQRFSKAQLQEMLSLNAQQLEQVTPDMTVAQIREIRKPKEVPYYEMEGQMEFEMDFPEIMPDPEPELPVEPQVFEMDVADMIVRETADQEETESVATSQQPEELAELLSAYGTPKKVYPIDSLIATEGCEGGHDCYSCSMECDIRQKDRYCRFAPMGNPFSCTTMNSLLPIREEIGNRCQFINHDLAFHRAGDGEPDPCCRDCEEVCAYRCQKARHEERMPEQETEPEVIDAEFEEVTEESQEEPVVIKDYDRRILERMIEEEQEVLDIMRDFWEVNKPDILTKHLMKITAYQMLLELHENEQEPVMKSNDQRKEYLRGYKEGD